jgi:hypothetical protein
MDEIYIVGLKTFTAEGIEAKRFKIEDLPRV